MLGCHGFLSLLVRISALRAQVQLSVCVSFDPLVGPRRVASPGFRAQRLLRGEVDDVIELGRLLITGKSAGFSPLRILPASIGPSSRYAPGRSVPLIMMPQPDILAPCVDRIRPAAPRRKGPRFFRACLSKRSPATTSAPDPALPRAKPSRFLLQAALRTF